MALTENCPDCGKMVRSGAVCQSQKCQARRILKSCEVRPGVHSIVRAGVVLRVKAPHSTRGRNKALALMNRKAIKAGHGGVARTHRNPGSEFRLLDPKPVRPPRQQCSKQVCSKQASGTAFLERTGMLHPEMIRT